MSEKRYLILYQLFNTKELMVGFNKQNVPTTLWLWGHDNCRLFVFF